MVEKRMRDFELMRWLDQGCEVPVAKTFHEQTDDELTDKEVKQIEDDDQAIQTILMGLPKYIYVVVDSCETTQEIWFTSIDGESIESYLNCFSKLMNDFKRNKHFPKKIASNLKFLSNLQPEWRRHVTIVHQTKDLHEVDYTQLYDFLKFSQVENVRNQNGYNAVQNVGNQNENYNRDGNVVAARAKGNGSENNRNPIEEVNTNCILMANLQQASTSGTQTDKAFVYDSDGSAEVHHSKNCYDNDIFNMFTQEEYVEQSGGAVEQNPATVEETRALYDSLYNNLAIQVEKVNKVNRKMKETNADLTTELARYKNQEKCFEINQEIYDKLERCYQKSVYQDQCLTKKINALHLSSAKTITTLNKEIANLNNHLSKIKSTVSYLQQEKKKLKSDFKTHEDELLDKQIQLENKIKELDKILVKTEAAKFVRDFKSLAKEADKSLAKHNALEYEIERLLRAVVSQDIISIVQNPTVVETSDLQTELECMKERFENCIIKKKNEYAKLWNDWYKKYEECKYEKVSYDKDYNDMQQKSECLQAHLGDLKGKSKDTPCVSDTLDPLSQKIEDENVSLMRI
ncbi:hypothetical protein Tco_1553536 [Tanacetum coccineum]